MTDNAQTNPIPHSREAEEAVIGAVLINPDAYYEVAQFLQAEDFYIHRHRFIWEAISRLHENRTLVDFLTLTEELGRIGQLTETGGPAYLTGLINEVPTSLNAVAYARIIEAKAQLREGNKVGAIRLLDSTWKEVLDCWLVRVELGKAYLEDSRSFEAYDQFDKCRNRRGEVTALFVDDIPTLRYLPPLYYFLGRAQEGLGSLQAADSYNTYISIKKTATDKDPLVKDARARLDSLN